MKTKILSICAFVLMALTSCKENATKTEKTTPKSYNRIVSINGAISEVIAGLGHANKVVATDVTSNYPEQIQALPKVGHNRSIQAEGILSQNPDLLVVTKNDCNPKVVEQIKKAGVKVIVFKHELSIKGTNQLIKAVNDSLNLNGNTDSLIALVNTPAIKIQKSDSVPKVLFIYARGAGTLMVAGEKTQMESIIQIAGGANAVKGFESFKPLTSEALVAANPDVILMFNSGASSLGNVLENVPGIMETNAGKNNAIITMDGQYLAGFGPRVGEAALELNTKLFNAIQ